MMIDLMVLKDWILGLAALITAITVIWKIIKKPSNEFNEIKAEVKIHSEKIYKLEKSNDKIEIILEKVNNLILLTNQQNKRINSSIEERELMIRSMRIVIKSVNVLLVNNNADCSSINEIVNAGKEIDEFIINEAHKVKDCDKIDMIT